VLVLSRRSAPARPVTSLVPYTRESPNRSTS
jgi:hypothetical protein